ncbi:MAG: hypothetical protein IKP54_07430 [Bacteroidales bacterium]|nr:hypothetical protein [Bacteroidales bacterium]
MKIILSTDSSISALTLRNQMVKAIKGEIEKIKIDTWSYLRIGNSFDIIYHNAKQYTNDAEKNVVFKIQVDEANVSFSTAWWRNDPEPSYDLLCLHTGRLTEMLLKYFNNSFIKFTILP